MIDLFGRKARREAAWLLKLVGEICSLMPRAERNFGLPVIDIVRRGVAESEAARAALAQARKDLKAANARAHSTGVAMATQSALDRAAVDIAIDRAEAAEKELADARHVIDQCEADRQAMARERDAAAMEAQAFFDLAVEIERQDRELLRLIGNAANQLEMAQGTTTRR